MQDREPTQAVPEDTRIGGANYTVQAIDSAISLLSLIADTPDLGLSELARRLGAGKARIYRQLKTLEARGLVTCSEPARTWRLGLAALMLGAKASRQMDLVTVAQPILNHLGERVQETVQLRAVDGDETTCIALWEPTRELRVHALIGRRRPLYAGSSKAILAHMSEAEQERIIALPRKSLTPRTILSADSLRASLRQIRRDGVGISRGEVSNDLLSISAPVFGRSQLVLAALNIAAPASRMDEPTVAATTPLVLEAAARLTVALGGDPRRRPLAPLDR